MKTIIHYILYFFALSVSAQNWTPKSDFPSTERDDGVSFTIGNTAYCGTGMSPWFSLLNDFYAFDLISEQWSLVTPLPSGEERQYALGLSDGLYGYVFGGTDGSNYFNDLWRYEPGAGVWQQMAPLPDSGRSGSAGFVINDTLYIIGGKTNASDAIADVWAYSVVHNTWLKKNDLPYSSWRGNAATNDSIGYFAFGMTQNGSYPKSLLEYNPPSDNWTYLADFPQNGLTHSSLEYMKGALISLGGQDSLGNYSNNLFRYSISSDSWTQLTPLPDTARKGGMVFSKENWFYYTTGITESNKRLKQTWRCENALVGLTEVNLFQSKVFPNPATNLLTVETSIASSSTQDPIHAVIVDLSGKVQFEKYFHFSKFDIPVSTLAEGVYLLKVSHKSQLQVNKIVKSTP